MVWSGARRRDGGGRGNLAGAGVFLLQLLVWRRFRSPSASRLRRAMDSARIWATICTRTRIRAWLPAITLCSRAPRIDAVADAEPIFGPVSGMGTMGRAGPPAGVAGTASTLVKRVPGHGLVRRGWTTASSSCRTCGRPSRGRDRTRARDPGSGDSGIPRSSGRVRAPAPPR